MPYDKSNKEIQEARMSGFKMRSGNATPFKLMGSSPNKMDPATMSMLMKAKEKKDEDKSKDGEGSEKVDLTTGM